MKSNHIITAAVAMGAKIIERHFTDNRKTNDAPDSPFAMDFYDYMQMVETVRLVESALGDGHKKVEENEKETVVLQRRAIRAAQLLPTGTTIRPEHVACLRPAPVGSMPPYQMMHVVGRVTRRDIPAGDYITETDI